MTGTVLGVLAGVTVATAWARWFRLMNRVRIPLDRTGFLAVNGLGAVLGIVALVAGTSLGGGVLAAIGILGGLMFLGLAAQSAQANVTPAIRVGEPILDFAAPDEAGKTFDLASLRGKPFLLKFFRGHW